MHIKLKLIPSVEIINHMNSVQSDIKLMEIDNIIHNNNKLTPMKNARLPA
jgi:hypothetical protein